MDREARPSLSSPSPCSSESWRLELEAVYSRAVMTMETKSFTTVMELKALLESRMEEVGRDVSELLQNNTKNVLQRADDKVKERLDLLREEMSKERQEITQELGSQLGVLRKEVSKANVVLESGAEMKRELAQMHATLDNATKLLQREQTGASTVVSGTASDELDPNVGGDALATLRKELDETLESHRSQLSASGAQLVELWQELSTARAALWREVDVLRSELRLASVAPERSAAAACDDGAAAFGPVTDAVARRVVKMEGQICNCQTHLEKVALALEVWGSSPMDDERWSKLEDGVAALKDWQAQHDLDLHKMAASLEALEQRLTSSGKPGLLVEAHEGANWNHLKTIQEQSRSSPDVGLLQKLLDELCSEVLHMSDSFHKQTEERDSMVKKCERISEDIVVAMNAGFERAQRQLTQSLAERDVPGDVKRCSAEATPRALSSTPVRGQGHARSHFSVSHVSSAKSDASPRRTPSEALQVLNTRGLRQTSRRRSTSGSPAPSAVLSPCRATASASVTNDTANIPGSATSARRNRTLSANPTPCGSGTPCASGNPCGSGTVVRSPASSPMRRTVTYQEVAPSLLGALHQMMGKSCTSHAGTSSPPTSMAPLPFRPRLRSPAQRTQSFRPREM